MPADSTEVSGVRPNYWGEIARYVEADRASAHPRKTPLEERLWSQVARGESCWLYQGFRNQDGYGRMSVGGRLVMVHRLVLFLEGREVPPGMVTRHKCHTPACVRPDHLEIGTQRENVGDTVAVGHVHRGEAAHNALLTDAQVAEIRRSQETTVAIAKRFGIAPGSVHGVRTGKRWAHVKVATASHPRRQGEKAFSEAAIRDIRTSSEPCSALAGRYGAHPVAVQFARKGITYSKYNATIPPQVYVTSTPGRRGGTWLTPGAAR